MQLNTDSVASWLGAFVLGAGIVGIIWAYWASVSEQPRDAKGRFTKK